jgi:hypothetical protein
MLCFISRIFCVCGIGRRGICTCKRQKNKSVVEGVGVECDVAHPPAQRIRACLGTPSPFLTHTAHLVPFCWNMLSPRCYTSLRILCVCELQFAVPSKIRCGHEAQGAHSDGWDCVTVVSRICGHRHYLEAFLGSMPDAVASFVSHTVYGFASYHQHFSDAWFVDLSQREWDQQ